MLPHRPEVRDQPIEHHAEREGEAREGEYEGKQIQQDALLLVHRAGLHLSGLVLRHDLKLRDELRPCHQNDHDDGDDDHRGVAICCADRQVQRGDSKQ